MFNRRMMQIMQAEMMVAAISMRAMLEWQRSIGRRLKREVLS